MKMRVNVLSCCAVTLSAERGKRQSVFFLNLKLTI